jgi:L-arabinokinase
MGYVIAMTEAGLSLEERPYGGYLANISLDEFMDRFLPLIPETISGQQYLDKYHMHIDPATTVSSSTLYKPRACALHPVQENHRIRIFRQGIMSNGDMALLGKLMLGSHEGYTSVGLGEPVTNRIVDLVRQWGLGHGIAGARISGGGSGGTVTLMVTSDEGYDVVLRIKANLEAQTGKSLKLFEGSSNGAHYRP